jgi:saccharopine dehydrogenase-like NADP-dependent oxidoreductase
MTRVLILGGYGNFGGRLAQLLAHDARLTLLIAGRSYAAAKDFCAGLGGRATLEPLRFDRDGYVLAQLRETTPEIVVDASGPFQIYGDDPYAVVKACIALKIHYLDLADATAFVKGIAIFAGEAQARDVFVLSGVSSFPVLTAAVVREISRDMAQIETVTAGVAPSPFADIGLNVFRAIASYAGKRLAILRDGRKTSETTWPINKDQRSLMMYPAQSHNLALSE